MAEDNRQFALELVQSQQNLVGASVAGGAAAITPNDIQSDSSVGILEQVRDITLRSFRKTTEIAKTLVDTLAYQKTQDRRQADQASEIQKEQTQSTETTIAPQVAGEGKKGLEGAAFALGAAMAPFFRFIKSIGKIFAASFLIKMLAPLVKLFGKGGFLFRFLGPLGPIGLIIGGVALLFKYSDEIVKALTPAVDAIKKLAQENAPLITALKNGFDFLFKEIIGGIGRVISGLIEDLTPLITGFSKLLEGDIMGGFKDLGKGLLNVVLTPINALLRFFEPVFVSIENSITSAFDSVRNVFNNMVTTISDLVTGVFDYLQSIPGKVLGAITGVGSVLVSFFTTTVPNMLKSAVNAMIDSVPLLPQAVKDKIKFDTRTPEQKEAERKVSEFGTMEKYTDRSITGGERFARGGETGGATMDEAYAEVTGEQYTRARITQSGTAGYNQEIGVLTPEQYQEYVKLDTDAQLQFLKNLDSREQERRQLLFNLYEKKKSFRELTEGGYVEPLQNELLGPDDRMLQDSRFQREQRNQAKALVGQTSSTGQTVIVNNQPTTVTSQNDIKKADMYSGNINTSSGDSYFERNVEGYA